MIANLCISFGDKFLNSETYFFIYSQFGSYFFVELLYLQYDY